MVQPSPPEELEVVLPGAVTRTVAIPSGPAAASNSSWDIKYAGPSPLVQEGQQGPYGGVFGQSLIQLPEPGELVYAAEFDEQGRLIRFFDNKVFFPAVLGDQFIIDGGIHAGATLGVRYTSVSAGVSEGDQFAVAAPSQLWFFGIPVGEALAYGWGTIDGDHITGTIGYKVESNLPDFVLPDSTHQYLVTADRR